MSITHSNLRLYSRLLIIALGLCLIGIISLKGWRLYTQARDLTAKLGAIETKIATTKLSAEGLSALCGQVGEASAAANTLRAEAGILLGLTPYLGWLPSYGGDLTVAEPLLAAAADLSLAATIACAELEALSARSSTSATHGSTLSIRLAAARPQLQAARQALERGGGALEQIATDQLSPTLTGRLHRARVLLPTVHEIFDIAIAVPALIGADGPHEYLVVVQNPDELRATGGFISAVGILRLAGGRVAGITFRDSASVDTFANGAYPLAPEPMRRYMVNQEMDQALWVFRDANWSADFPSSARTMLDLYRLGQGHAPTDLIALNPRAIQLLLATIGPVAVQGTSQPVSADNVINYMHNSWTDAVERGQSTERKEFLNRLGTALVERLQRHDIDLLSLGQTALRMLDEREVQLFLPTSELTNLIAERGWDGALRPSSQDFLMVVSANVGYNKVNSNIRQHIDYAVDLSNPAVPIGAATVTHSNLGLGEPGCEPVNRRKQAPERYDELTIGCYWNYLQVFTPGGSAMAGFSLPPIPASWLPAGGGGRIFSTAGDTGTQLYSTLIVVPRGGEQKATFRYRLPPTVIVQEGSLRRYRVVLQKQPGMQQQVSVQILLPPQAKLIASSTPPTRYTHPIISFELDLTTDQLLELSFQELP